MYHYSGGTVREGRTACWQRAIAPMMAVCASAAGHSFTMHAPTETTKSCELHRHVWSVCPHEPKSALVRHVSAHAARAGVRQHPVGRAGTRAAYWGGSAARERRRARRRGRERRRRNAWCCLCSRLRGEAKGAVRAFQDGRNRESGRRMRVERGERLS